MPRPRKPTAVLEMNGSFKHDPQRKAARANEPEAEGELGNAPTWMTDAEKKVWREVKKSATWLTSADQIALEAVCKLTAKMRFGDMKSQDYSALRSLLAGLGLTAADRSRVNAPTKKTEQPQDEFAVLHRPGNLIRRTGIERRDSGLQASQASMFPVPQRPQ